MSCLRLQFLQFWWSDCSHRNDPESISKALPFVALTVTCIADAFRSLAGMGTALLCLFEVFHLLLVLEVGWLFRLIAGLHRLHRNCVLYHELFQLLLADNP